MKMQRELDIMDKTYILFLLEEINSSVKSIAYGSEDTLEQLNNIQTTLDDIRRELERWRQ